MSRKKLYVLLLIGVGLTLAISACSPKETTQDRLVDLTGRVTGTDTTVYLSDVFVYQEGAGGLTDTTDANGYFELDGIPLNSTTILFEKEGYQKYELKFEYIGELKKPLVTRWIRLKKIGEVDPVASDSAVTDSM